MTENIIQVNYEDEMKQSYIDYAMSVIVERAFLMLEMASRL